MADNPFQESQILSLFEIAAGHADRLRRRESTTLEFKANFSMGSLEEYSRTMAAFANHAGGYVVFGVTNQPHLPVGMTNNRFGDIEPARVTEFLNDRFTPALDWSHYLHEASGKTFGLIHVAESTNKPVVCITSGHNIRDGDVYYRYHGRTQHIKSSELQQLIDARIASERDSWRNLLMRSAQSTPSTTYLLDVYGGRATGPNRSFVISPQLLEKVKFIHEGRLAEGGSPTLNIIGDVEVVRTETVPETIQEVLVDPSKHCELWEADVVRELNRLIGRDIRVAPGVSKRLSGYHVRAVVGAHRIMSPSPMYFRGAIKGARPQYGREFVDCVYQQFGEDDKFFLKAIAQVQSDK